MPKATRAIPLKIAVATAYLEQDWHSARLFEALAAEGEVSALDPGELGLRTEPRRGAVVTYKGETLEPFDLMVLARGLSPAGDVDLQLEAYRVLEEQGALLINKVRALLDAEEKIRTSLLLARRAIPTPQAEMVQSAEAAARALRRMRNVVVKPPGGSLGYGVERVNATREGEQRLRQRLEAEGALFLQRFRPSDGSDLRAFVVGGRLQRAIRRVAKAGEFRTNVALGGKVYPAEVDVPLARLAVRSAAAVGLDYAGVDILIGPDGPEVIEVNGHPAFDMIFEATGEDMARAIAAFSARRAHRERQRPRARKRGAYEQ